MTTLPDSMFVSGLVHEREVTMPDGSKHVLHFREVPAADFRKFHRAEQSADDDVHAGSLAVLIAASLCEPDGTPALTFKKALMLKPGVMNSLFTQILAINGFGDKEKKD